MIDVQLPHLQRMVGDLTDDLRTQVLVHGVQRKELAEEWERATAAKRTAASFETWLADPLDQAAVAWVLGCVFVRFCEDNKLVDGLWIGGPSAQAPAAAAAQQTQAYLTTNFRQNERDWLREAFAHLRNLPATHAIFDQHNPVWRFDISGDRALDLLEKLRRGVGVGSLVTDTLDTRFLGDLYQDLSQHAKKTYALLQTPEFVEEFILDRAFEPALAEFGLADMKVIDPACGSGHFVIGAFHRLVTRWREANPDNDIRELTQRALDQVTGVDINPFAIAIARFRLLVAALKICDVASLETAPEFRTRLAAGDSLLEWGEKSSHQGDLIAMAEGRKTFAYHTEGGDLLADYLQAHQYTVVLANPPYITVKDKARNGLYREMYSACSGTYALTIPFAQRLFRLANRGDNDGYGAGWVGQITANSFMKREFGKKLIEDYFRGQIELSEVIDTSGAYIPGHGTPTVILIGRNRLVSTRYSGKILTVLGIRGEPGVPENPSRGLVWSSIASQIRDPGSESQWVSVASLDRSPFMHHPWSLGGGGAVELVELIESRSRKRLKGKRSKYPDIGFGAVTREDDAYVLGAGPLRRAVVPSKFQAPMVDGETTRDWSASSVLALWPYDSATLQAQEDEFIVRLLWPHRSSLSHRIAYGKSQLERKLKWFEYSMFFKGRYANKHSIAFAGLATHNHFTFDRGGRVFNRWAPVIKLMEGANEDDHLRLLGVLNSSTACFWLKQVSHNKGSTVDQRGARQTTVAWENFYEFTGTKLKEFPLPAAYPLEQTRELDLLAQRLRELTPWSVAEAGVPTRGRLAATQREYESVRARMIALQEELDWEVYRLYGLLEEDLTVAEPPELLLGERAFEIILARKVEAGEATTEWFTRHGSSRTDKLPVHWPDEYRALVEKRIALIESNRNIGLIERPECKRRWQTDGWDTMQEAALRSWMLDRLEAPGLWAGAQPTPLTVAQLADRVRGDEDFRAVLDLWVGNDQYDPAKLLAKLVADEYVPYLPAQRYKKAGLRKRAEWERTWALQRREDAGEKVGTIPVPPKYTSADFTKNSYWRNRGKLDVPKERFVSYPDASPDTDGSLLLGWAGWDHVKQAQALATVYVQRKDSRWPREQLLPLLAGLAELQPWLHQWHTEPRDDFPMGSPATFFTGFIDNELSTLNAHRAELDRLRGVEELS